MYAAVPRIVPVPVAAVASSSACSFATPKSRTFSRSVPSSRRATNRLCGFEIAMDDPGELRGLDAPTRLRDQVGGALHRQPALALEQVGEAFADEVLHDDEGRAVVGDAEIDGGRHVVVLQRPRRLGLALEPVQDVAPLGEVAAQELDREAPPDDRVMRLVHDAHPAPREQANDAVLPADDLTDTSRVGGGLHRAFSVSPRIVSRSTCPSIRR